MLLSQNPKAIVFFPLKIHLDQFYKRNVSFKKTERYAPTLPKLTDHTVDLALTSVQQLVILSPFACSPLCSLSNS